MYKVYTRLHRLQSQTKHEFNSLPYHRLACHVWKVMNTCKHLDLAFVFPTVWRQSLFWTSPFTTLLQGAITSSSPNMLCFPYHFFTLAGTLPHRADLSSNSHPQSTYLTLVWCLQALMFWLHSSCSCYSCYSFFFTKYQFLEDRGYGSPILFFR